MSDSKNNDKGKDYSSSDMFTVDAKLLQALASLTPEQRELLLKFAQAAKSPSASENSPAPSETPPVQSATPQQTAPKNVSANISLSKSAPPKLRRPSAEPTPPPVLLKSTRVAASERRTDSAPRPLADDERDESTSARRGAARAGDQTSSDAARAARGADRRREYG